MLGSLPHKSLPGGRPPTHKMGAFQVHRRNIASGILIASIILVFFRFCSDIPFEYYRNYGPDEFIATIELSDHRVQSGYFKYQPEWDWEVPHRSNGWGGYARKPLNRDIVVLTASDGGGHNSAIPNVLERVIDDRDEYCQRHGYTHLWLNTSRYDIGDAHRTWSKIPAVAEAFHLYPSAEWVWLIDTDIIVMTPDYDLVKEILSPAALQRGLLRNELIRNPSTHNKHDYTNTTTPQNPRVEDIDVLITQDHQSVNTGSMFFRRTAFTRFLLEMMTDNKMLMGAEHQGAEQDAIKHLMLEHQLVRNHVGVYPQRKFNAYAEGGEEMGYRDGDLVVHFAGCWTGDKCLDWFEMFWAMKGHKDPWRPEESQ